MVRTRCVHLLPGACTLLFCLLAPAAPAAPVVIEAKLLEHAVGGRFDNPGHLAGAIDFGTAASVGVNGVRGIWGLDVPGRHSGGSIGSAFIDGTQVGVQWEISGLREVNVVLKGSDAPQFGRSTGGTIGIRALAGSDTVVPGLTGKTTHVRPPPKLLLSLTPTLTAEYVAYSQGNEAFFVASNASLTPLVKAGDPVPGRPGQTFAFFTDRAALSARHAAFIGAGPSFSGVYLHDRETGNARVILDNDTLTDPYRGLSALDLGFGKLAIGTGIGLFVADPERTAAPELLVPAGTEYAPGRAVGQFRDVTLSPNRIAFRSLGSAGGFGAFLANPDGSVSKIADQLTPVPGNTITFGTAQQLGLSDELAAFIGFDSTFAQAGLFGYSGGELFAIARPGDVKDGKTIRVVDFLPGAIDENVLAYTAYFTDGSSASYLAAVVPEPAQWLCLTAGLVLLLGLGRARPGGSAARPPGH